MSKRNIAVKIIAFAVLAALAMPNLAKRISYEKQNNNVVFALNYNNAQMVLSEREMEKNLAEYKKIGVNTALVGEESVNSMISAGYITAIKYNVLLHKYDDESEDIIKQLEKNDRIHNDSYVLITKREHAKKFLKKWIPSKYTDEEYKKITTPLGADVYVLYDDAAYAWQIMLGFDEEKIKTAHDAGFDVALATLAGDYTNTEYTKLIAQLVKKYDIKYLNLKENAYRKNETAAAKKNTAAFKKLIEENKLTLVLTENADQLSNQKPNGYAELIESAKGRVIRSYETTDFNTKNTAEPDSTQRYYQVLNSVIDRNIRFVSINQLTNGSGEFSLKAKKTLDVTNDVMKKLRSFGYNTDKMPPSLDGYTVHRRTNNAVGGLMIILMWLSALQMLTGKTLRLLQVLATGGGVLCVGFCAVAPMSLVMLVPTLFALSAPCFAITVVMTFIKKTARKTRAWILCIAASALSVFVMCAAGGVLCSLLGGSDYYINSVIFRGIKLSLLVPIVYAAVAYWFIFGERKRPLREDLKLLLTADIKVYWVIIFAFIATCGAVYIVRSGNVKTISGAESFMRNTVTNLMSARPRTKEFLVGWPALLLTVYYVKETNIHIIRFICTVGAAVLYASIMNSFCHVFTGAQIIFSRVFNGMLLGLIIGAAVYVVSLLVLKSIKRIAKKG